MAGRLGAERDPGPAPAPRVGGPRRFPAALRALEHHDFRRFWLGQVVSLVGRWMQAVAQSWLVLELTGSPLKLGIVNSLPSGPSSSAASRRPSAPRWPPLDAAGAA